MKNNYIETCFISVETNQNYTEVLFWNGNYITQLEKNDVVPGSSVGIATDKGLHSPGSNPCGDEIFLPSRPALGPPSLL